MSSDSDSLSTLVSGSRSGESGTESSSHLADEGRGSNGGYS